MQSSQLLPLGSLLLSFATPLAQADALHDQASALFKPIPEQVTELPRISHEAGRRGR